jgi:hypothetical protein
MGFQSHVDEDSCGTAIIGKSEGETDILKE